MSELSLPETLTLDWLNQAAPELFAAALGGIFEHSPWVAEQAASGRPFDSVAALHAFMVRVARNAPHELVRGLLRAHPDLATRMKVTRLSAAEQHGAGLDRLTPEEYDAMQELNRAYTSKFGFPFILAVRGHNKSGIMAAIALRVTRTPEEEWEQARHELGRITRVRLDHLIVSGS